MNAKTILEELFGWKSLLSKEPVYKFETPDGTTVYVHDSLLKHKAEELLTNKYGSVQQAAEEAAKGLGSIHPHLQIHKSQPFPEMELLYALTNTLTGETFYLKPLDLIAEAVQAGWEG